MKVFNQSRQAVIMMSSLKIKYFIDEKGVHSNIELNGINISELISKLDIKLSNDGIPIATLEVATDKLDVDISDLLVELPVKSEAYGK